MFFYLNKIKHFKIKILMKLNYLRYYMIYYKIVQQNQFVINIPLKSFNCLILFVTSGFNLW